MKFINLQNSTIYNSVEQARSAYFVKTASENNGYGTSLDPQSPTLIDQLKSVFPEYIEPTISQFEKLGSVVASGDVYTHEVLPWSQSEIDEYHEQRIDQICESAKYYVEHEINAAGMFLIRELQASGKPTAIEKANAVEQWVNSVYLEAEYRKALIYADMWDDNLDFNDFKMFGKKPYTMAQLMMER